jgi:hypothetical protein
MSRTTRRPRFLVRTSETEQIQRDIAYAIRFPHTSIRVPMTEQELEELYQRQLKQYAETGTWA